MSISVSGAAQIRHAETGEIYTIEPDELVWDQVAADERQMGVEIAHSAVIDHSDLGQISWTLWEYPLGMENDREVDVGPHTILESFRLSLDGEAADEVAEREARVEAMVKWFFAHYEDPANQTPVSEGEYIYIWGGPYDAREQIGDNFTDEDEDLIEAAVSRVERDGTINWAPILGAENYEEGDEDALENQNPSDPSENQRADDFADRTRLAEILRSIPTSETGLVLSYDPQERIEFARWTPSVIPDQQLLQAVRGSVGDLLTQLAGTNAHPDLLAAVGRYREAVGDDPLSIPRLYVEGVQLENTSDRVKAEIGAGDRPALLASVGATIDTVLEPALGSKRTYHPFRG